MNAETKQIVGLFGIATVILILLWLNQRRIAIAEGAAQPLTVGTIQPANYDIWQFQIPGLTFTLPDMSISVNELYYTKSICACQE